MVKYKTRDACQNIYSKDEKSPLIDATDEFKQCGFSEKMLNPWTRTNYDYEYYVDKLKQCKSRKYRKF